MANRCLCVLWGHRLRQLLFVIAALATGCNATFDIHEGKPRSICADPLLIDDMEDGLGDICSMNGRRGGWYTVGDGTSTDLTPEAGTNFSPTLIGDGKRGTSRYAAHFTGSGFTAWGALMGFSFTDQDLARKPYDASTTGGIKFWMKSNVPVSVNFLVPETVLPRDGGDCADTATALNCNNHFSFEITAPSSNWTEYEVPYLALSQIGGSATWNPRLLLGIEFLVRPGTQFDVWVDDISFYYCGTAGCVPTCKDPNFPVVCPAGTNLPAACRQAGVDCNAVAGYCSDPQLIDDMEDGDGTICNSGQRNGNWYTVGGDGSSTTLEPAQGATFTPTLIPGGRGTSHYAAHLSGSGFTNFALMGFNLEADLPYDASSNGGIKFWLKSNVPVSVTFGIPATIPNTRIGGTCFDSATEYNCDNNFRFLISAPNPNDWQEYVVPFAALRQDIKPDANFNELRGSATWTPSRLVSVNFSAETWLQKPSPGAPFETWVDDVRFYTCSGDACDPTCDDPSLPVTCPASGGLPADCWSEGTDCSKRPVEKLYSVWGSGPNDVWAVGESLISLAGVIRHWDGSVWSSAISEPTPPLWSVSGIGPSDAWAVSDHGKIIRWNGAAWSISSTGTEASLNDVWGSGSEDIWAIANPSTLLHWDGANWSDFTTNSKGSLWDLWGTGRNDVWAVGDGSTILHWDGSAWSPIASGTDATIDGLWGTGPNNVWAVGNAASGGSAIVHWDGVAWATVQSPSVDFLNGVWGSDANDIWAVGSASHQASIIHWDGTAWSHSPSPPTHALFSVWGSGPNDIWAVGADGVFVHWNGGAWSIVPESGGDAG